MKSNLTKIALVLGLLVGSVQQAHAVDVLVLIPNVIANTEPFQFTARLSDDISRGSDSDNPFLAIFGAFLFPFAILDEANHNIILQDETLAQAGYSVEQIAEYKLDLVKIGSALNGKRVTKEQFKQTLSSLSLSETTREIMQLK